MIAMRHYTGCGAQGETCAGERISMQQDAERQQRRQSKDHRPRPKRRDKEEILLPLGPDDAPITRDCNGSIAHFVSPNALLEEMIRPET
jgi:hypothetical protein